MEGEEDKNKNFNAAFNRGSVKIWHKEGIIKKYNKKTKNKDVIEQEEKRILERKENLWKEEGKPCERLQEEAQVVQRLRKELHGIGARMCRRVS